MPLLLGRGGSYLPPSGEKLQVDTRHGSVGGALSLE